MINVGDMVIVKKPPSGSWTGFMSSLSVESYDYHKRFDVAGPQFGIVIDIRKWHAKMLLQENSTLTWLPLYALKELQSERTM